MPQLVDDNQEVKEDDDLEDDEENAKGGSEH